MAGESLGIFLKLLRRKGWQSRTVMPEQSLLLLGRSLHFISNCRCEKSRSFSPVPSPHTHSPTFEVLSPGPLFSGHTLPLVCLTLYRGVSPREADSGSRPKAPFSWIPQRLPLFRLSLSQSGSDGRNNWTQMFPGPFSQAGSWECRNICEGDDRCSSWPGALYSRNLFSLQYPGLLPPPWEVSQMSRGASRLTALLLGFSPASKASVPLKRETVFLDRCDVSYQARCSAFDPPPAKKQGEGF